MQITHQNIVERRQALQREAGEAYKRELARINNEKLSLQELCGGLGHVFEISRYSVIDNRPLSRHCVFCQHAAESKPV